MQRLSTKEDGARETKSTPSTFGSVLRKVILAAGLLTLLYSHISWKVPGPNSVTSPGKTATVDIVNNDSRSTRTPCRILVWTPKFGDWPPELQNVARGDVVMTHCVPSCHITRDRFLLESSDAIVFHARDTNIDDLPDMRIPSQIWVLRNHEPPDYTSFDRFLDKQILFNWTMTYRSDSDVPVPYGRLAKRNLSKERDYGALWASKKKMAVWMVSNCQTPGNREEFAKELGRYIDVDVFGACGSHFCSHTHTHACYKRFRRKYFFMFAFENSLCRDYVTEKFFIPLMYDIVPVVFGGANYSRFAPPGSYINALDFETPAALAEHLKFVAGNASVYKSYFRWKTLFRVERMDSGNFWPPCELCSRLHNRSIEKKIYYENILKWWEAESQCWWWTTSNDSLYKEIENSSDLEM